MSKNHEGGRLIFLSGPSCMGKGTLVKVLKKFYPELYDNIKHVVMYNSRKPRPGETDGVEFRFRPRAYVEQLVKEKGPAGPGGAAATCTRSTSRS